MSIEYYVISEDTAIDEVKAKMKAFQLMLDSGKQVCFVVRKGAFEFDENTKYENSNTMLREDIIKHIVAVSKADVIISTTGKASRELFEIREANGESHAHDFLTVGSMGHSSSIALEIALQKPHKKIWIIDGDGAALMHMGSMVVLGANNPRNIVHIVINNGAHETVGGQPTVMSDANLVKIAEGCGYQNAVSVDSFDELDDALNVAKNKNELSFIEIKCAIGSRANLGRPTSSPKQNKEVFMRELAK